MTIRVLNPLAQEADVVSVSGAITFDTSPLRSLGRGKVHAGPAGAGTAAVIIMGLSAAGPFAVLDLADGWCTFHWSIDDLPDTDHEIVARAVSGPSTRKYDLDIRSDGKFEVYDRTGTLVATGTLVVSLSTVYRIAMRAGNGAAAAYEVWVALDGQPFGVSAELSGTCDQGATQLDRFQLGKAGNKFSQTMSMYYQDAVIDDAQKHEHFYIGIGLARANGANTAWTDDWDECDEHPHDGATTVISTSTSGAIETFLLTAGVDLGIGSGDTIHAIQGVNLRAGNAAVVNEAANITFVSGASTTHSGNANLAVAASGFLFGGMLKLLDPQDSAAWTRAKYDAIEVGCRSNSAFLWSVTSVMGYVMFTPAVASASPWHYYQQQMAG